MWREHYRDPKLEDTGGSFIVTLYAKNVEKALGGDEIIPPAADLNERQQRALAYLDSGEKRAFITKSVILRGRWRRIYRRK